VVLVAPGQPGNSPAFPYLLAHLQVPRAGGGRPRTRPDRVRDEKGVLLPSPPRPTAPPRNRGSDRGTGRSGRPSAPAGFTRRPPTSIRS
jgi:putative transposase